MGTLGYDSLMTKTQSTETPAYTAEDMDNMRDSLVRDCGVVAAAWATEDKILARIAKIYGSVAEYLALTR